MTYQTTITASDLRREQAIAAHRESVIAMSQDAERQGLTEEQLLAELEHLKRQVFGDTYGNMTAGFDEADGTEDG